ncbi:oxygen-regulated protein 1 [Lampris incognitus]|uniref:oxygen-regulated protein 1 n=1 Tax=Lampris incognitus TaxID=2546036 RepID=UPI0024B5D0C4|nr:oxygen-regulated protein 1 [Lampris incognitus]
MSHTSLQEPPAQRVSSGSVQTLASRPLQLPSDPSASKRVCFYKSGDYKFSGHRMVINARTFKTFDALLDALSKKVPLPFGVRTITTPRGTQFVKGLEDLQDGGSYVCSDQKRVKPLNLDAVYRRQVPWNNARPVSAGRRGRNVLPFGQFGRRNEANNRPAKITDRAVVRTPKRLAVIKNRDPTIKHTIVLQRRTAPTFDALLDYLSQILQFPVLKLYSTDGRRIDGLLGLILCSGVIVAAGNEPFKLGNNNFQKTGHVAQSVHSDNVEPSRLQPRAYKNKSLSSGRGSRNYSLSSERYIVNQINKSLNGSISSHHNGFFETEANAHHASIDMENIETVSSADRHGTCIAPQDEDIEKSFCINQDGSMTVEMKVRLTIKEEEMLHWTTTVSRTSLNQRMSYASKSGSRNSSPDSNNGTVKNSSDVSEDESKEENHPNLTAKGGGFTDEGEYRNCSPTATGKPKSNLKRTPTPGPRHIKKKASVDSIKTMTERGIQERTLGQYSYTERTAGSEMTEEYCVVRQSNSSKRPVPKPRKTASAGKSNKGSQSSIKSTGVAEVLQIQNNGTEITETVMHIYERQGCYDNYFANNEYSIEDIPGQYSFPFPPSKPASTESAPHSSSNDCDIDFSCQSSTSNSLHRRREEILSLSSDPISPTHEISYNFSSLNDYEARTAENPGAQSPTRQTESVKKEKKVRGGKTKKVIKPTGKHKSSPSTSSSDTKKDSVANPSNSTTHSSADKVSNATLGRKSGSSSDNDKKGQKARGSEKFQLKKKVDGDDTTPSKKHGVLLNSENVKGKSSKNQMRITQGAPWDNGHNVNKLETETARLPMRKNVLDILQRKQHSLPSRKVIAKQKSMTEKRTTLPKPTLELSESVSMPVLNPMSSDIHQYVENWLQKISSDSVPYMDQHATEQEAEAEESEPQQKVVFQIGGDSESESKSDWQDNAEEHYLSQDVTKSMSCLSVPVYHEVPTTSARNIGQKAKGLCVSMPSVRVDPVEEDSTLRTHKSAENIGLDERESLSSTSNLLNPQTKIKPVLQQLCSSIQCIRRASDPKQESNLEKSRSLPDFSSQVASVFGSPSKTFLSFLSLVTLRESLTGSVVENSYGSEAMLVVESLQKISVIEDEEEQRASLTDLQNRTSSQLRERWQDFQVMRERLESEPLSPKFSEQEFALEVVSEGGDTFDDQHIDELMEELNIPQDLREEISSTFQQKKSFYPDVEESTFVEKERHQSDSEEELEQFVKDHDNQNETSSEPSSICITETIAGSTILAKSESDPDQGADPDVKESEHGNTEIEEKVEPSKELENDCEMGHEADVCSSTKSVTGDEENVKEEEGVNGEYIEDREREWEEFEKEGKIEELVGDSIEERQGEGEVEGREEEFDKGEEEGTEEKGRDVRGDEMVVSKEEVETEEEEKEKGGERAEEEMEGGLADGVDKKERWEEYVEGSDEEWGRKEAGEETDEEEQEWEEQVRGENVEGEEEDEEVIDLKDEEELGEGGGGLEVNEEEPSLIEEIDEEEEGEEEEGERGEDDEGGEKVTECKDEEDEVEEVTEEKYDEEEEDGDVLEKEDEEEKVEEEEDNVEGEDEEDKVEEEDIEEEEEVIEEEEEIIEGEDKEEEEENGPENEKIEERETEEGKMVHDGMSEEKTEWEEEEEGMEEREIKDDQEEGQKRGDERKDDNVNEAETGDEFEEREEALKKEEGREEEEAMGGERDEWSNKVDIEAEQQVEVVRLNEEWREGEEEEEEEEEEKEQNEDLDEQNEWMEEEGEPQEKEDKEDERYWSEPDDDADSTDNGGGLLEQGEVWANPEEKANTDAKKAEKELEVLDKSSSDCHCDDDKGQGTDTENDFRTDDGEEEEERQSSSHPHPVEISQELLDFINSALQASSLIFTYDARGNMRIEPDNAQVVQTKQIIIPKSKEDRLYGLKRLPSPSTSDLSDYRPETSGSGGYKSHDSIDITTESGEELLNNLSPDDGNSRHFTNMPNGNTTLERTNSKPSLKSKTKHFKSGGSFSSYDSGTKVYREDLSYFSGASSLKGDAELATEPAQCTSFPSEADSDGVLIDQGRWLLKENHLIRKSPPLPIGMYGNLDSTSIDTAQENASVDSPPHYLNQHNPLTVISSSELEEMAKPQTPKCTYYNIPHGSDSDPFLDDVSVKSRKKGSNGSNCSNRKGFKVSPTIDTSKTWARKNSSLSSFASVEFKLPDSKVHPEGETSAMTRARRSSSVAGSALQSQDSLDTLRVRCGQYCPIL